jgi:hypothetical protein
MIREKIYLRILSLLKIHLTGADILGQAIGIGKGKRDLTRIRSNPTTSRNRTRNSLEMPVGKGRSALSSEVIMQLTGRFRLRNAR